MNRPKKVSIPVILFVFVTCINNPKATATEVGYEFGKKLPMNPFMVLDNFGLQMCFKECEVYGACFSISYNRKHLVCELNSKWTSSHSLVNDGDYIYKEIQSPVSFFYSIFFQQIQINSNFKQLFYI